MNTVNEVKLMLFQIDDAFLYDFSKITEDVLKRVNITNVVIPDCFAVSFERNESRVEQAKELLNGFRTVK